jgi:thiosulfate/3-mercaptopyruvate sulfurtransferase
MRRAGVSGSRSVVVYDDVNGLAAARIWWLLSWAGHQDVRLLDGGLSAWRAAGGTLESGSVTPDAGDFVVEAGRRAVVDAAEAAALARRGVLLDARSGDRYRGESEPFDHVAGHIPGARSAPTVDNLTDEGRFRDAGELRERFEEAGVEEGAPLGVYCGSGVTAAHELLALELAGIDGGALYVGSWSEWVADPDRHVAAGPERG